MSMDIANQDGTLDLEAASKALDESRSNVFEANENSSLHEDDDKKPSREDDSADPGDEQDEGDDWTTSEDVLELVESLGLSEEDLEKFSDRDEFDKHVTLMDKIFAKSARPGEDQEAALEAQEQAQRRLKQREKAKAQPRENGKFKSQDRDEDEFDPGLDLDYYDEKVVDAIKRSNSHAMERIKQLEAKLQEREAADMAAEHARLVERFDLIVDNLGHDDLFGTSDAIKPKSPAHKNRAALWDAAVEILDGMRAHGKSGAFSPGLVKRALNMAFADKISQQQRRTRVGKIEQQSRNRLGSGGKKTVKAPWSGPAEKDPELLSAFDRLAKEYPA